MKTARKPLDMQKLHQPELIPWLLRALQNWGEIALIFYLIGATPYLWVKALGVFLLGTRQHALALLGHEAIHGAIAKNPVVNHVAGTVFCSFPLFQSLEFYRSFHIDHHAFLLSPGDPETGFRAKSAWTWKNPNSPLRRLAVAAYDLTGLGYLDTRHALPHILKNTRPIHLFSPLLFWVPVAWTLVHFDLAWVIGYWALGFVTSYWAMFRQRALTEHIDTDGTHLIHANWLQRFLYLPHNTWCHYEHHLYARVPCWKLQALRRYLIEKRPELYENPEGRKLPGLRTLKNRQIPEFTATGT